MKEKTDELQARIAKECCVLYGGARRAGLQMGGRA